jgi:hypothetical protein
MSELTRRDAVGLLAGGSMLGANGLLGSAQGPAAAPAPAGLALPPAARAACTAPVPALAGRPLLAQVARCRSFDACVYLDAGSVRGYALLTPAGFALAAACQAAGRPVAMKFREHEPDWQQGAGRFHGVVLAIDAGDLAEASELALEVGPWS